VIETNEKIGEIGAMFVADAGDEFLRRDPLVLRAQHDRRAVRVVGADVIDLVTPHALEARPDVGLDVFDHVAQVDGAVGIGQGGGDEDAARHGALYCYWLGVSGCRGKGV